jgi:tRNA pseudouridine55 synthase
LNGVLVIDKPKGWTSHDVVARVRKMLGVKKAGHGGTLDPLATGVLPIYLGEGTKLVPFNLEGKKEYVATLRLGQETDTLDAEGKLIAEKKDFSLTRSEIETALLGFHGTIRQTPPLFSAIKKDGQPLYKRARAGEKPPVPERKTTIDRLSLKELADPFVTIEVTCSRGTYVRSLCADIGRVLGCGAHLVELRRLRSGKFTIEQSLRMEDLSLLIEREALKECLISLRHGVDIPRAIRVPPAAAVKVCRGQYLGPGDLPAEERDLLPKGERVCLLDESDTLLAVAEARENGQVSPGGELQGLKILRVFHR